MGLIRFCLVFLALANPVCAAKLFLTTEVYPPYNLQGSDGSVRGVYFDQLKIILEDTGTSYEVAVMPWARAIALATTQPMHCAFATARTAEREKLFKWVSPIHIDRNILVARRKANINVVSLEDAKKYRVGTQRGDYTETLLETLGFPQVDVGADFEITLHKLTAGRIDLMPMSESTFKSLPAHTFREVTTLSRQQLGLACNKSVPDEVIAKLQARLDELIADGTQQRIFDRYDLIRP
ncbi:transporter substrate-binding domain-containing protein [Rhizobium pusense]|uniref:substrate-binding periplasmic protein n=1 Tax=Agrobacterium pusense TaxID=648995 RepID=UPI001FCDBD70|nr:transporter substrate-binding domain-containing protein [Agrobacterium pusense]MCJ2875770.1 transporter substrate-binding domain-containing protein [Agrobacterium pusense]